MDSIKEPIEFDNSVSRPTGWRTLLTAALTDLRLMIVRGAWRGRRVYLADNSESEWSGNKLKIVHYCSTILSREMRHFAMFCWMTPASENFVILRSSEVLHVRGTILLLHMRELNITSTYINIY